MVRTFTAASTSILAGSPRRYVFVVSDSDAEMCQCAHVLEDRSILMEVRYRSVVIMDVNRQDGQIRSEQQKKKR